MFADPIHHRNFPLRQARARGHARNLVLRLHILHRNEDNALRLFTVTLVVPQIPAPVWWHQALLPGAGFPLVDNSK